MQPMLFEIMYDFGAVMFDFGAMAEMAITFTCVIFGLMVGQYVRNHTMLERNSAKVKTVTEDVASSSDDEPKSPMKPSPAAQTMDELVERAMHREREDEFEQLFSAWAEDAYAEDEGLLHRLADERNEKYEVAADCELWSQRQEAAVDDEADDEAEEKNAGEEDDIEEEHPDLLTDKDLDELSMETDELVQRAMLSEREDEFEAQCSSWLEEAEEEDVKQEEETDDDGVDHLADHDSDGLSNETDALVDRAMLAQREDEFEEQCCSWLEESRSDDEAQLFRKACERDASYWREQEPSLEEEDEEDNESEAETTTGAASVATQSSIMSERSFEVMMELGLI